MSATTLAFPIITVNPPPNVWVAAGPLNTLYPYGLTPGPVSIVSTSAADTALGIGARTVLLVGSSTADGTVQFEIITLNGTTPVVSTLSYRFVLSQQTVQTVGSNGSPVGNIVYTLASTTVHKIRAGYNGDISAAGTIASNLNAFFFNQTYWADKYTEFRFQIRNNSIPNAPFIDQDLITVYGDEDEHFTPFDKAPLRVHPLGDAQTLVRAKFPNTQIIISARGALVDNSAL